jgi:hypothetical protein
MKNYYRELRHNPPTLEVVKNPKRFGHPHLVLILVLHLLEFIGIKIIHLKLKKQN